MKTKTENMKSYNGNSVPNQFIITTDKGVYFQSYKTVIAAKINGEIVMDRKEWDCSNTTGKYRNQFLDMDKKQTVKAIEAGEIKLADLN